MVESASENVHISERSDSFEYSVTQWGLSWMEIIYILTSYLSENAVYYQCKAHIINSVQGNNNDLFWELYKTRWDTLCQNTVILNVFF